MSFSAVSKKNTAASESESLPDEAFESVKAEAKTDDNDAFADAPPPPSDSPAAKPAANGVEASLDSAVEEQPMPDIDGAASSSSGEGSTTASEEHAPENTPDPEAELEIDPETGEPIEHPEGVNVVDYISGLRLGASSNVLLNLLKTAVPAEEAVTMLNTYYDHLQSNIVPQLSEVQNDRAALARRMEKAQREAAHQATGGGFLSNFFAPRKSRFEKDADAISSRRKSILEDNDVFAQRLINRIQDKRRKAHVNSLFEMGIAGEGLKNAVNTYNQAALDADNNPALKAALAHEASKNGLSVPDLMSKVVKEGSGELFAELSALNDRVKDNPKVQSAKDLLKEAETNYFERARAAGEELRNRAFHDNSMDMDKTKSEMLSSMKLIEDDIPESVESAQERELRRQRLAEMREQMSKMIENLINAIMAKLGLSGTDADAQQPAVA